MVNTFKDLLDHLNNRAKNVLYSTFIISFIVVNWDTFYLLLFSNTEATNTLINVRNLYDGNVVNVIPLSLFKTFFLPLMASFIHIFLISYLSEYVYKKWAEHQASMNNIAARTNSTRLISVAAAQLIRNENIELKLENDKLKSEHMEELKAAKASEYSALDFYRDSIQGTFEDRLFKLQESPYNILTKTDYEDIVNMKKGGASLCSFDRQINVKRSNAENFKELAQSLGFLINYPSTSQDQVYLGAISWKD